MTKKFKRGQPVEWDSSQGTIHGVVERTVTETTRVKGHVAKAGCPTGNSGTGYPMGVIARRASTEITL